MTKFLVHFQCMRTKRFYDKEMTANNWEVAFQAALDFAKCHELNLYVVDVIEIL